MPSIDFKKQVLPHLIAISIFALVVVIFFAPVFFEGKSISQHDIMQALGGSKEVKDYKAETGEETLWTNSMFGGMPSYLVGAEYHGDLIKVVQKVISMGLPYPVSLVFLSCLCFYIMLLCFKVRSWLAIIGALAYGLTGFVIISLGAGHNLKIAAVAFMPLVLGGIHLSFDRNKIWGFILTALGLALELRVNHLQITYYLLLIVLAYGLSRLIFSIKEHTLPDFFKTLGILVIAAGLAVGANFGRMWTLKEYSEYSTRGKSELSSSGDNESGLDVDYAFQYSNGITEPIFLFIPNFFGGSMAENLGKNSNLEQALRKNGVERRQIKEMTENAPAYWGDQPATAPYYAGAIVVFLFVLSLFVLDSKHKYWLLGMVLFSVMLSWGKNFESFNYFIFDYLPGYNKFRSVTFTIIITVFCIVLSALMGLEKLLASEWNKEIQKKLFIALSITGGFALLSALLAGIGGFSGAVDSRLPEWYAEAIRADRESLLRMDALRSLFFVMVCATLLWLYFKNKMKLGIVIACLGFLVFIDLFLVDKRLLKSSSFQRNPNRTEFTANEADKRILQDKDPNFRVYNLINSFAEARTSYFHKSIGGYHGAKMGRYQDLVEHGLTKETSALINGLQSRQSSFSDLHILNMLNTKYFIAGTAANLVMPNSNANGNAWFVSEVKKAGSPDEEIEILNQIDTKQSAVVDTSMFKASKEKYSGAHIIQLLEYKPNYLKYEATCFDDAFAVFSEIYYPKGWTAKIDSTEVDIHRANYVLRALEVPEGTHTIEFEFKPNSYYTGNSIMMVFGGTIILCFFAGVFYTFRGLKEEEAQA
ncbi:MAG: YfhO family protein [Cyclobacteriaceae bacterium]